MILFHLQQEKKLCDNFEKFVKGLKLEKLHCRSSFVRPWKNFLCCYRLFLKISKTLNHSTSIHKLILIRKVITKNNISHFHFIIILQFPFLVMVPNSLTTWLTNHFLLLSFFHYCNTNRQYNTIIHLFSITYSVFRNKVYKLLPLS